MSFSLPQIDQAKIEEAFGNATKFAEQNPLTVGVSAVGAILASLLLFRKSELKRDAHDFDNQFTGLLKLHNNTDHNLTGNEFKSSIEDYESMFDGARKKTGAITDEKSIEVRKERYAAMINHFYNLVTDFYEWGWGQSFHFAPRWKNETFMESIKRIEHYLAARLHLVPGMKVLDVGCGVGGPMRNIATFSGANIEGITINEYQVKVGNKYNQMLGLGDLCLIKQGDFQNLNWPDNYFDAAYAIEATCHSPDRTACFSGVAKKLKPFGHFAILDWVMLPGYDVTNPRHVQIKEGIEVGNGLPTLVTPDKVIEAFEGAGFEVLESHDLNDNLHDPSQIPWYETLNGSFSLSGLRMTFWGRMITHSMVWTLETLRIAPAGSTKVSALLNATAIDLVDGGKDKIFTPSYFFLAKKKN